MKGSQRVVQVLVLVRDLQACRRWRALLEPAAVAWLSAAEVPNGETVDVLLTDFASADQAQDAAGRDLAGLGTLGVGGAKLTPATWTDAVVGDAVDAESLRTICQLLSENAQLRALADIDPLTGLGNRRMWQRRLQAAADEARRSTSPYHLAIVDLDRFKEVNELLGFTAADTVLKSVAESLASQLEPGDVIARLGGDEFGLLLRDTEPSRVAKKLERHTVALAEVSLPDSLRLTASIGYAQQPPDADPDRWFATAESALRHAKRKGGDRIVAANDG
jgi:diguanylate cyclase (GGDEF)-like protein